MGNVPVSSSYFDFDFPSQTKKYLPCSKKIYVLSIHMYIVKNSVAEPEPLRGGGSASTRGFSNKNSKRLNLNQFLYLTKVF